ncbi:hypothetical protein DN523_24095 [Burkholderia multivorans]|nr:hypothetical protein DN471_18020 [Burkholderia multivorans]RAA31938.1 hypothetical protein DN470_03535 [Burkholderia multivorans]RAA40179.1 hypothetical protein DN472_22540 [Burkholderia multivorans]RAA44170.1 hypothetical protein DN500_13755 [Burkholderia multivorans]RAA57149.1 hypothetical protein DN530_03100 [Burkholderia multivorans]
MSISFRCAVRRTTPVRANRASARSQNDSAPAVIPLFLHIALRHAHGVIHRAVRPRDRSCRRTRALATAAVDARARSRPQLSTHARARDRCATLQRGRRRTISSSEVEIDPPLA